MGNSTSRETPPPQISEDIVSKGLPTAFRIVHDESFSLKASCHLVEHGSDQPSYTISLPSGWYGDMILHGGPTADHPPLATVTNGGSRAQDFTVHLPAVESAGVVGRWEIVRHVMSMKTDTFWFGIRVGEGENRRSEKFEWRHSRGSEVKKLGQANAGWKLVRLGSSSRPGGGVQESGVGTMHGDGFTKDGKEIVAIWAHGKTFGNVKNMGEFQFLGSGATGEFGIQWNLMVVMSCFCVWLRTTQQSTTTAGI